MWFWKSALGACMVALVLTACGGGGGDSPAVATDTPTTPQPQAIELSFLPAMVTANQQFGSGTTVLARGSVRNPSAIDGELHVQVVDPAGVLSGAAPQMQRTGDSVALTVQTNGGLAAGRHTGEFEVRLCRDAACARAYPGSPFRLGYDIHVVAQALVAQARTVTTVSLYAGAAAPAAVTVDVTGLPVTWTASTSATWLSLAGANGSGNGAFEVRYQVADLATGTHQGIVRVLASDGQRVDLPFTVTVLPSQFTVNGGALVFTAINGAAIAAQPFDFQLVGAPNALWTVTPSVAWLTASPSSGTTQQPVQLRVRPEVGLLASGTHTAQLALRAPGMTEDKLVPVQLNLMRPTLSVNSPAITLGGPLGRDLAPTLVPLSLNTGLESHPFSLESLPAWMDGSTRSGRVSQGGVQLSLVAAAGEAGTRTATATVKATVNGDVIALPLTISANRDQRRLLASQWGVGFSSTPRGDVLARTLTIRHNFGDAVSWTAVSDKPWLTVTPAGTTAGASTLALTADPASVSAGLDVATVVVRAADAGADVQAAIVRVGLYKDAAGLPALVQQVAPYVRMVTDPVRPYIYAHGGGSTIDVLNVYTAQKVASFTAGTGLGLMAVSRDGMTLYATDAPSSTVGAFDLATLARRETVTLVGNARQSGSMTTGRVNGVDILLFSTRSAYQGQREFADFPDAVWAGDMVVSSSGTRVYVSTGSLARAYDIDHSAVGGGTLTAVPYNRMAQDSALGTNNTGVALSPDDGTLYLTSYTAIYPVQTRSFGARNAAADQFPTDTPLPTSDSHLRGLATTWDGRIVSVYLGGGTDMSRVYVYTPAGAVQSTQYVSNGWPEQSQFGVSPDGAVAVMLSDSSYVGRRITFIPIAP